MNTVAPNSPSDTAKANPAATSSARRTIGRSTSRHTRHGDAPSTAAASRSRPSTARSTGSMVRTTKGTPTSACASGTRIQERPQVQRRLVERDQEAEADGHRGHAERQHQQRVEASYEPARAAG